MLWRFLSRGKRRGQANPKRLYYFDSYFDNIISQSVNACLPYFISSLIQLKSPGSSVWTDQGCSIFWRSRHDWMVPGHWPVNTQRPSVTRQRSDDPRLHLWAQPAKENFNPLAREIRADYMNRFMEYCASYFILYSEFAKFRVFLIIAKNNNKKSTYPRWSPSCVVIFIESPEALHRHRRYIPPSTIDIQLDLKISSPLVECGKWHHSLRADFSAGPLSSSRLVVKDAGK